MDIIGVDFSGAKPDRNTWVSAGVLVGNDLRLDYAGSTKRADLTKLLKDSDGPLVAAMDFPFAVPKAFAEFWQPDAKTMPELWEAAAGMELADFLGLRQSFPEDSEPKRKGDEHHPGCYSPLHTVNPVMTHMTFYGMQMLHTLRSSGFHIPPLPKGEDDSRTLLEVMPGAVLRHLGLPSKGYKNGLNAPALRNCIWENLSSKSGVALEDAQRFKDKALNNHDCLDSIVAAVAAAIWHSDQGRFRCQPDPSDQRARLEGWLYALSCDSPGSHPQP